MIAVNPIFTSIIWILGLSIILGAWSMAYYRAQASQKRVIDILNETRFDSLVNFGAILTFIGWGAADSRLWVSLIWFFLAALSIVRLIVLGRQRTGSQ